MLQCQRDCLSRKLSPVVLVLTKIPALALGVNLEHQSEDGWKTISRQRISLCRVKDMHVQVQTRVIIHVIKPLQQANQQNKKKREKKAPKQLQLVRIGSLVEIWHDISTQGGRRQVSSPASHKCEIQARQTWSAHSLPHSELASLGLHHPRMSVYQPGHGSVYCGRRM